MYARSGVITRFYLGRLESLSNRALDFGWERNPLHSHTNLEGLLRNAILEEGVDSSNYSRGGGREYNVISVR
jgi:hypothetical protein